MERLNLSLGLIWEEDDCVFCTQSLQLHRLHSVQSHYSTVTAASTCHCRVSEHYTFFLSGHKSGFFFFTFCSVRRRHTSIFISIMETGPSLCLRQDDRRLNLCQVSNIIMMYTICLTSMTLKPVVSWYCLWLELRRLEKTGSEKVMKGLIYQYRETNKVQFDLNVFFLWHSNWFCARV